MTIGTMLEKSKFRRGGTGGSEQLLECISQDAIAPLVLDIYYRHTFIKKLNKESKT